MPDAQIVERIESKFNSLVGDLDERGKRRWAAAEAMALGRGGIAAVAMATGLSDRTIRTGIEELRSEDPLPSGRQRRPGAGRKPLEYHQHDLVDAIDRLVEPTERGDPQSPLRWTCKSLNNLQYELRAQGYSVSHLDGAIHHPSCRHPGVHLDGAIHHLDGTPHLDGAIHHPSCHLDGAIHHPSCRHPHLGGAIHHPSCRHPGREQGPNWGRRTGAGRGANWDRQIVAYRGRELGQANCGVPRTGAGRVELATGGELPTQTTQTTQITEATYDT